MIRMLLIFILLVIISILFLKVPQNRQEVTTWSDYYKKQEAQNEQKHLQTLEDEGKILIIK